jgi:hypothetical protein
MTNSKLSHPPNRRLRVFAFDPSVSRRVDTSSINIVTIKLPWEENVKIGPVDDYLEIVDYDPASQVFYPPIDLNDPYLLAQDGLTPSESNPLFHQQMVYAVARTTIDYFENALGRKALWSSHWNEHEKKEEPVERLRIYPHAMREANAYYSPEKKALLFGYFPASMTRPGEALPGEPVFTCLSQDIVAHETTHALLDGLHRRFAEPANEDLFALHEAFADIVALFQHFSYPDVLKHQIARTRGNLEAQNLLGELAYQFGQATGRYGALRSAIGKIDPETRAWIPIEPDPHQILTTREPHLRGAILVAALFEAFLTIYKSRIVDLLRIASGGTGILPAGELHPDLVNRLAEEASKTAKHVLKICIRAMDYIAPVDADFGDFLRALVTADLDMVKDDTHQYRLAVIDAFRKRGIFPRDVRNLNEESLVWHAPNESEQAAFGNVFKDAARLRDLIPHWELTTNREMIFKSAQTSRRLVHSWFLEPSAQEAVKAAGLVLDPNAPEAFYRGTDLIPKLEVHSVRPARRIGPAGQTVIDLVIEMTQRRRGYRDPEVQEAADRGAQPSPKPDFIYRGGCTLLVDPNTARVRYCVYKRILSKNRLERMRRYLYDQSTPSLQAIYFGDPRDVYFQNITGSNHANGQRQLEPFALLHRSFD